MELVVVVSPKGRDGHGPEAWGRRHRKRTRRRIPRLPRRPNWVYILLHPSPLKFS